MAVASRRKERSPIQGSHNPYYCPRLLLYFQPSESLLRLQQRNQSQLLHCRSSSQHEARYTRPIDPNTRQTNSNHSSKSLYPCCANVSSMPGYQKSAPIYRMDVSEVPEYDRIYRAIDSSREFYYEVHNDLSPDLDEC